MKPEIAFAIAGRRTVDRSGYRQHECQPFSRSAGLNLYYDRLGIKSHESDIVW
jgi:hypothetical protein